MQVSTLTSAQLSTSLSDNSRPRQIAGVGILIAASLIFSFAFTCAIPLAAMATFAALKLKPREAVLSIGAVWLINQLAGFGCLNYPRTPECFAWGIGMGIAAYAALMVAMRAARHFQAADGAAATLTALAGAFITFKAFIFGLSFALPSGTFSWPIFVKILIINAATLPALLILNYLSLIIRRTTRREIADERSRAWYEQQRDTAATL
jgi:hypothetical protein